jgi:hypothetical protein
LYELVFENSGIGLRENSDPVEENQKLELIAINDLKYSEESSTLR